MTIVNGFGGQKRTGGLSFIIDNVAYIVGGTNNGKDVDDFWKFDPSKSEENKWVRLRDITDQSSDDYDDDYKSITRTYGCAFVIDDQAYITLGQTAPVVSEVITGYTILLKTYGAAVKRKMILTTLLSKEVHASKRFVSLPADEVLSLPEAAAAIIMTIHGSYIHMNGKRMTKRKILGCSVAGILIVIACLSFSKTSFSKTDSSASSFSMEVIEVNGGYGYQISHNNHITIFSLFIPSISGKKPFMEKRDAEQVGQLVMKRMKSGENYTVTLDDLESLGIKIK